MDVACKTGTTDSDTNVWLCGYTPYYAGATWYGFDAGEIELYQIWAARSIWANIIFCAKTRFLWFVIWVSVCGYSVFVYKN